MRRISNFIQKSEALILVFRGGFECFRLRLVNLESDVFHVAYKGRDCMLKLKPVKTH